MKMKDYRLSELIQLCKDRMKNNCSCKDCPILSFCLQIEGNDRPGYWEVEFDEEITKCDCYHEVVKTRPITDFERGLQYGKSGKWVSPNEYIEYVEGKCWGTRECETCHCGGDRSKCDHKN